MNIRERRQIILCVAFIALVMAPVVMIVAIFDPFKDSNCKSCGMSNASIIMTTVSWFVTLVIWLCCAIFYPDSSDVNDFPFDNV
jgi:hypothetical protein